MPSTSGMSQTRRTFKSAGASASMWLSGGLFRIAPAISGSHKAAYAASTPAGPSPLARLVAAGNWASALGQSGGLALSGAVAGKRFFDQDARGDDVLIVQTGANGTLRVAGRTIVGLAGSYFDAFQRGPADRRDFRSLAPTLRIEQGFAQAAQITLGGGYRWYTFKSDENFSFAGPTAFVTARQMFGSPDVFMGVAAAI